ncbi:unnamed protein product [Ascophyllum nodosum]
MWFRKYFWVASFDEEMKRFGKSVFRPMKERMKMANKLHAHNALSYTSIDTIVSTLSEGVSSMMRDCGPVPKQ